MAWEKSNTLALDPAALKRRVVGTYKQALVRSPSALAVTPSVTPRCDPL